MKTESAGWLDSNVILRYLLNDHADHSARARALIEAAEAGAHRLKVALHILCEVVYILESERYAREEIYGAIRDFMGIRGIEVEEEDIALEALTDYRDKGVDFSDALLAAIARRSQETVWTFNRKHFVRMAGLWQMPPVVLTRFPR